MAKKGTVDIHGREYKTVALRVAEFRENFPISDGWGIVTNILEINDEKVVVQAHVTQHIPQQGVITVGSGLAEEVRSASKINRTSALEVAETSAIGRALASVGLGGEEYASADELVGALRQQDDWQSGTITEPPEIPEPPPKVDMEDVPDNIIDLVNQNCNRGCELLGDEEYLKWHKTILANMWGVDSLEALEGPEAYAYFYRLQNEKLKGVSNE